MTVSENTLIGFHWIISTFLHFQILKLLIQVVDADGESDQTWNGLYLAFLLFVSQVISTVFDKTSSFQSNVTAINIRNSLVSAIHRKTLRLSNAARWKLNLDFFMQHDSSFYAFYTNNMTKSRLFTKQKTYLCFLYDKITASCRF